MTVHDWHTHFPTSVDTATELPDVASGDPTRITQLNTIADILIALETRALTPIIVTSAALAGNQALSDTNNPPTVAMPNLGTLSLTTVVGETIVLIASGNGYVGGTATAVATRFAVDGAALSAGNRFVASYAAGLAAQIVEIETFTATATSHVISLLASQITAAFTMYAGFAIHAIQFR